MTMTLSPDDRLRMLESDRAWLAEQPPLPTADELARPIIDGLMALHGAFSQRAEAMLHDLEQGTGYETEARQLWSTAEGVASLLRTCIGGLLAHEFRSWRPLDMDGVVRAITQSPLVENALNSGTVFE